MLILTDRYTVESIKVNTYCEKSDSRALDGNY